LRKLFTYKSKALRKLSRKAFGVYAVV